MQILQNEDLNTFRRMCPNVSKCSWLRSTPDTHSWTSLSTYPRGNPRWHFEVPSTTWSGRGKFTWTDPRSLDFDWGSESASYAHFSFDWGSESASYAHFSFDWGSECASYAHFSFDWGSESASYAHFSFDWGSESASYAHFSFDWGSESASYAHFSFDWGSESASYAHFRPLIDHNATQLWCHYRSRLIYPHLKQLQYIKLKYTIYIFFYIYNRPSIPTVYTWSGPLMQRNQWRTSEWTRRREVCEWRA